MISNALIGEFKDIVGSENVFTDPADLVTYSYDAAVLDPVIPGLALRPTSSEALGRTVRLCHENGIPLTVRGAGTNLSGGTSVHLSVTWGPTRTNTLPFSGSFPYQKRCTARPSSALYLRVISKIPVTCWSGRSV